MYIDFHGFVDALVCLIAFHVVKTPNPIVKPKAILDTLMSERLEEIVVIVARALENEGVDSNWRCQGKRDSIN